MDFFTRRFVFGEISVVIYALIVLQDNEVPQGVLENFVDTIWVENNGDSRHQNRVSR